MYLSIMCLIVFAFESACEDVIYRKSFIVSARSVLKILLAIVCLAVVVILVFRMNRARPVGGIDEGRLFLAGATSLMQGKGFQIVQRTPLYSLFLASLGYAARVDPNQTIPGAHEYGNIENVDVATGFLQPRFQRLVLIVQLAIWIATLFLVYKIGRSVNLPIEWALVLLIGFIPISWILVTYIYDPILTQFLLVLGLFSFCAWLNHPKHFGWIFLSAASFSISALSRPTFQILTPLLALIIWLLARAGKLRQLSASSEGDEKERVQYWKKAGTKAAIIFVLSWFVLIGTYSLRNYLKHGFFGVSGATGLSLSGRAAPFLEKAQPFFPEEVGEFLKIREIRGNTWGARGIKWLMSSRGMTWPQANIFLVKVCTAAIVRAPMRYLVEVGKSVITFHMPSALKGERSILIPFYFLDALLIALFLICSMMWVSFHLMRVFTPVISGVWSVDDSIILLCLAVYWYCALISSGVDYGRPEHRISVLFLIPLTSLLILRRFEFSRSPVLLSIQKRFHK